MKTAEIGISFQKTPVTAAKVLENAGKRCYISTKLRGFFVDSPLS